MQKEQNHEHEGGRGAIKAEPKKNETPETARTEYGRRGEDQDGGRSEVTRTQRHTDNSAEEDGRRARRTKKPRPWSKNPVSRQIKRKERAHQHSQKGKA